MEFLFLLQHLPHYSVRINFLFADSDIWSRFSAPHARHASDSRSPATPKILANEM